MTFTIITVCLDAARTIAQSIESVLAQSRAADEYIVIDGGSTDGTREIIERYRSRLSHVIFEPDDGIYDAFNKGLSRASGDVIGILNADDMYAPWALATVEAALRDAKGVGVTYGKLAVVDEARRRWTVYPVGDHRRLRRCMSIAHPATFVTRETYERHGSFDTSFRVSGDWDLMLRFLEGGVTFQPIDATLTAFRNSGVSSAYSARRVEEDARIYRRYLSPMAARRAIFRMSMRRWGRWAIDALGLAEVYARHRDERLLHAEASGTFDGDVDALWRGAARSEEEIAKARA